MAFEIFTGIVLLNDKKQIYLVKEDDKHQVSNNRWNLPGGAVKDKESLTDAATREALEETGYTVKISKLIACYKAVKGSKNWIYFVFSGQIISNQYQKPTDPHVKEGRWFTSSELKQLEKQQLTHPDIVNVYQRALERKGLEPNWVRFKRWE